MKQRKLTFTSRSYLKFLIPIPVVFGLGLLVSIFYDFGSKTNDELEYLIWFVPIIMIFFFGIPYFTFKYIKVIDFENGKWSVNYPYLNRTIHFDNELVSRVEIIKNVYANQLPRYTQINIRFANLNSIHINSLEIKDFDKFIRLLEKEFKNKVELSDFWKGK